MERAVLQRDEEPVTATKLFHTDFGSIKNRFQPTFKFNL
ncbi:MAG: hypothetical protein QOJ39_1257 [Candidatus Eremiobacteraeota bacterium]|nr:hypothetical protein [Candidatus Eremiobacteraeota bacterium]